jgi:hypothetical protein
MTAMLLKFSKKVVWISQQRLAESHAEESTETTPPASQALRQSEIIEVEITNEGCTAGPALGRLELYRQPRAI